MGRRLLRCGFGFGRRYAHKTPQVVAQTQEVGSFSTAIFNWNRGALTSLVARLSGHWPWSLRPHRLYSAAASSDSNHSRLGGQISLSDPSVHSAIGGGAWLLRRMGPGGEHCVQVSAGVGIVGLESQWLLELANRLLVTAFAAEGDAEVIVGIRVSRFQVKGFLVLAGRLVNMASPDEGVGEVVVGVGFIWVQTEGFLELADRLVNLAFLVEGKAKAAVREVIVLRDFERMPE